MEKTDKVLAALYAEALHSGNFAKVTWGSKGMK